MTQKKRNGWLSRLFSDRPGARSQKDEALLQFFVKRPRLRRILLGVGFSCLVITIILTPFFDPLAHIPIGMSRQEAIEAARLAAWTHGINVTGWRTYVNLEPESTQLQEKILYPGAVSPLDRFVPPIALHVFFWNPKIQQHVMIFLTSKGDETGFKYSFPLKGVAQVKDRNRDAALAEAAFRKRFPDNLRGAMKPALEQTSKTESSSDHDRSKKQNDPTQMAGERFVWRGQMEGKQVSFIVRVAGGRIIEESLKREDAVRETERPKAGMWLEVIRMILIILLWTGAVIFGIFRLGFRLREREVAFHRALLLIALVVVCALCSGWVTDHMFFQQLKTQPDPNMIWIVNLLGFLFLGIAAALIWVAGDGDLREVLPGSVTSFDAFLGRKFMSRNVGRSVLIGIGVTGIYGIVKLFLDGMASRFHLVAAINFPMTATLITNRWGGSDLLLAPITVAFVGLLFLLMLPFSFKIARGANKGLFLFALIFMLNFSPIMETSLGIHTSPGLALTAGLLLGLATVLALWWGDLLTALVFFQLQELPRAIGITFSQGNDPLRINGITMGIELLVISLIAAACVRWGREWSEEEVRPLHARNMAERKKLKEEFELARITRTSLMPPTLEAPGGIDVADWVVHSSEIGGDYRDAFALPDGRWGWVVVDCGGQGTGAAIAMALTKGLLLAYTRRNLSAAESAKRIEQGLRQTLGPGVLPGFVYGLHDLERKELTIARFGDACPHICWRKGREGELWQRMDVKTTVLPFSEGSGLVCWTDGVEMVTDPWGIAIGEKTLLAALPKEQATADHVINSLKRTLKKRTGRLRNTSGSNEIVVVALTAVPAGGSE